MSIACCTLMTGWWIDIGPVTIQCNVVVPYFGRIRVLIASLSDVKCSIMLWSDDRNIKDY